VPAAMLSHLPVGRSLCVKIAWFSPSIFDNVHVLRKFRLMDVSYSTNV
jgi:hypothetical protein